MPARISTGPPPSGSSPPATCARIILRSSARSGGSSWSTRPPESDLPTLARGRDGLDWPLPRMLADAFFASSKRCNVCGALNDALALSDREWDCGCGAHHERDFLAACNLRDEGFRMLAAGQTDN